MTGDTHRAGGMLCSVVGFALLKSNNLLLPDISEVVQLMLMYPFCMWGSVASDLDHHWDSCPDKNIPSLVINKALHLTTSTRKRMDTMLPNSVKKHSVAYKLAGVFDASHRSWQTHSDLTLILVMWLLYGVLKGVLGAGVLSPIDVKFIACALTGVCIGLIAHFILDALTPSGIWCTVSIVGNKLIGLVTRKKCTLLPEKIRFVPKSQFFATGGGWETIINMLLKTSTILALIYVMFFMIFTDVGDYILSFIR